jgi:predicted DNA-binding transcriptional regulator AlpA
MNDDFLAFEGLKGYTTLSQSTLQRIIKNPSSKFPPARWASDGRLVWSRDEVKSWLLNRPTQEQK